MSAGNGKAKTVPSNIDNEFETTYKKAIEIKCDIPSLSNLLAIKRLIESRLPGQKISIEIDNDSYSTKLPFSKLEEVLGDLAKSTQSVEKISIDAKSHSQSAGAPYKSLSAEVSVRLKQIRFWVYGTTSGKPSTIIDWGDASVVQIEREKQGLVMAPKRNELVVLKGKVSNYIPPKKELPAVSMPEGSSMWGTLKSPVFIIPTALTIVGLIIAYLTLVRTN
jgi:hypothetical protein